MKENYHNSEEYKLKTRFLILIDGGYDFKPVIEGVDSCMIGLCKMEYIDNVFHVYLRRPGLLIGKKGETINRIEKLFSVPIKIHEVDLMRQSQTI